LIHFGSVDDSAKLKSSEWNVVWIEEATELSYEEFMDIRLCLRSKSRDGKPNQIYLSFNPIDEFHWIKERLIDDRTMNTEEIISTYKDNPFLPEYYVKNLEDLQFQDISYYNIYTLGNWGKLENIIYKNWVTCDWLPSRESVDSIYYGLDFGFNKPTALLRVYQKGKDIWEEELLYHLNLTNSDLILKLEHIIPENRRSREVIFADSAEPDRIKEIQQAGFRVKPGDKKILPGIEAVKRFNVHVHVGSNNIIKEKRSYSWRKDRSGRILDEPIDFMNHLQDGERYAVYTANKLKGVRLRVI
jgi:phage terminase large subunit